MCRTTYNAIDAQLQVVREKCEVFYTYKNKQRTHNMAINVQNNASPYKTMHRRTANELKRHHINRTHKESFLRVAQKNFISWTHSLLLFINNLVSVNCLWLRIVINYYYLFRKLMMMMVMMMLMKTEAIYF